MTTSIFDMLDTIEEIDLDVDLIGGPNLRLRSGGDSTFAIENRTGYIHIPEDRLRLQRFTVSNQNGMTVVRAVLGVKGEEIGILGDNDEKHPLPLYTKAAFTTWRSYVHLMNVEFMNPDEAAVKALTDLVLAKGFVPYEPRFVAENPYQRADGVEILFDREAPGTNLPLRWENGVILDSCVLIPDVRADANVTEYQDRHGDTVRRPGFTSFPDTLITNMATFLKAEASKDQQAKRDAVNRLSVLTGHNPETDWPLRPTLGYVTPKGHDEINLFGEERSNRASAEKKPAETETAAPSEEPKVEISEEPFED